MNRLFTFVTVSFSLVFFGLCKEALAVDYYVSPNGTATWQQCQNITMPCSAVTGMNNAAAGDTVYFLGGTYYLTGDPSNSTYTGISTYQGRLQPAHSGTFVAPITFKNYSEEVPVFDVTHLPGIFMGRALGTNGRDYIVFDGLTIRSEGGDFSGSIIISAQDSEGSSDYNTINNCTIIGGSINPGSFCDNTEGIRIEQATNTSVENNKIYNFQQLQNACHDFSGVKLYNSSMTMIRNNEFYNNTAAIYSKGNGNMGITVAYNYFHNNSQSFLYATVSGNTNQLQIHNNLFYNDSLAAISDDTGAYTNNDFTLYNNTIVDLFSMSVPATILGYAEAGHEPTIYNNIFYSDNSDESYSTRNVRPKESDHNLFYTNFNIEIERGQNSRSYFSLPSWQSSTELCLPIDVGCGNNQHPDCGSIISDPAFVNMSGALSTLNDFMLSSVSPAKGAGRNGIDMGANISLVGIRPPGSVNTISPSVPSGLSVH